MGYKGISFFLIITRMFRKIYFKIILIPYLKTCINILIWCILNSTINTGRLSHQQNQLNLYNTIKKKINKKMASSFFFLWRLLSCYYLCFSLQLLFSARPLSSSTLLPLSLLALHPATQFSYSFQLNKIFNNNQFQDEQ